MKKITLVRHGKSSWEHNVSDTERPLKKRGINDADLVSREFYNLDLIPEVVYSSPAKRAFETCKIFVRNLNISEEKVEIHNQLYDFGGHNVIDFIKSISNTDNNVMIFGHNHAFTSIVNNYGSIYIDNMPTSGLAILEFEIDSWNDLKQGKTIKTIFPRDLKMLLLIMTSILTNIIG